jgi:hypothetical protein
MNTSPIFQTLPLERVREGMTVFDSSGRQLGTVDRVRMGEPGAVTTSGENPDAGGAEVVVAPIASVGGTSPEGVLPILDQDEDEAEVPEPLWTELSRVGFIKVDGPNLKGASRFIPGDRIAEVSGDTVRLRPAPEATVGASIPAATPAPPAAPRATPWPATGQVGDATYKEDSRQWLLIGGGAGAAAAGVVAGVILYRRRQAKAQRAARLKASFDYLARTFLDADRTRVGGVGGGLLLSLLLAALARRARGTSPRTAAATLREPTLEAIAAGQQRLSGAPWLALAALAVGFFVGRRRGKQTAPHFIGTPGVESAAGRDRTLTGELPLEFGVETPRR